MTKLVPSSEKCPYGVTNGKRGGRGDRTSSFAGARPDAILACAPRRLYAWFRAPREAEQCEDYKVLVGISVFFR